MNNIRFWSSRYLSLVSILMTMGRLKIIINFLIVTKENGAWALQSRNQTSSDFLDYNISSKSWERLGLILSTDSFDIHSSLSSSRSCSLKDARFNYILSKRDESFSMEWTHEVDASNYAKAPTL